MFIKNFAVTYVCLFLMLVSNSYGGGPRKNKYIQLQMYQYFFYKKNQCLKFSQNKGLKVTDRHVLACTRTVLKRFHLLSLKGKKRYASDLIRSMHTLTLRLLSKLEVKKVTLVRKQKVVFPTVAAASFVSVLPYWDQMLLKVAPFASSPAMYKSRRSKKRFEIVGKLINIYGDQVFSSFLTQRDSNFYDYFELKVKLLKQILSQRGVPSEVVLSYALHTIEVLMRRLRRIAKIKDFMAYLEPKRYGKKTLGGEIDEILIALSNFQVGPKKFRSLIRKKKKTINRTLRSYLGLLRKAKQGHKLKRDFSSLRLKSLAKEAVLMLVRKNSSGYYNRGNTVLALERLTNQSQDLRDRKIQKMSSRIDNYVEKFSQNKLKVAINNNHKRSTFAEILQLGKQLKRTQIILRRKLNKVRVVRSSVSMLKKEDALALNRLEGFLKSKKWKNIYKNFRQPIRSKVINISAQHAKFPESIKGSIVSLSSGFRKIQAKKGDLVKLEVTGKWSPVCALKKSSYGKGRAILPKIGPEGYSYVYSKGNDQVASSDSTKTKFQSSGERHYTTHRTVGEDGKNEKDPAKKESTFSHGREYGNRESTSSSKKKSNTTRTNASFMAGLRLKNTPFADLPAGSLLLVQMRPGGNNYQKDLVDIDIVTRNTGIIVQKNVDLYLVVNDCKNSGPSSGKLKVRFSLSRSLDKTIRKSSHRFLKALSEVRKREKRYIKKGSLTPNDRSYLKKLWLVNGGTLAEFSAPQYQEIKEIYNLWFSRAISMLEYRVNEQIYLKEVELINLEVKYLQKAIHLVKQKIVPFNLVQEEITNSPELRRALLDFENSLSYLTRVYFPSLSLINPLSVDTSEIDSGLKESFIRSSLQNLNKIGINSKIQVTVNAVNDFLKSLVSFRSTYRNSINGNKTVTIRIPNPFYTKKKRKFSSLPSNLSKLSKRSSREIWKSIKDGKKEVRISLSPSDLYKGRYSNNNYPLLKCNFILPRVKGVIFYFSTRRTGNKGRILNTRNNRSLREVRVSGPSLGVGSSVATSYLPISYWLRHPRAYFLRGSDQNEVEIINRFKQAHRNRLSTKINANGVSPFSTFIVGVQSSFGNKSMIKRFVEKESKELRISFEIEYMIVKNPISWLKKCSRPY